jgi:hypothetical protein
MKKLEEVDEVVHHACLIIIYVNLLVEIIGNEKNREK